MATFGSILKKLIVGEPVFDGTTPQKTVTPAMNDQPEPQETPFGTPRDDKGLKVLPEVVIKRLQECKVENGHMECQVIIENRTPYRMQLDRIKVLSTQRTFDEHYYLDPHEEYEYIIYSGPTVKGVSDYLCELYFKNDSGDYFNARHKLEFSLQPDNTYSISTITFEPPIQDIYE